jgi:thioredoxin 1
MAEYDENQPERAEIDALPGATVLEFGSNWCGWCAAAEPLVESALGEAKHVRHVKVADGSGRPLGRSFRVKLWPTLVFLKDGKELGRVVRPASEEQIRDGLRAIV